MKVEIQARQESSRQLRAESLQQAERMSASVQKVDKKVEVVLGAQRMLHGQHEALQVCTAMAGAFLASACMPAQLHVPFRERQLVFAARQRLSTSLLIFAVG